MTSEESLVRYAPSVPNADGTHEFRWQLTAHKLTDAVRLVLPPSDILPVIFVPGIMGSNLRSVPTKGKASAPVWRLDTTFPSIKTGILANQPLGFALKMSRTDAGRRQSLMHPDRTEVDPGGVVPQQPGGSVIDAATYTVRGWGEVGEGSYSGFLLWLEQVLNGQGYNPAWWSQFSHVAGNTTPFAPVVMKLEPGIAMQMVGLPPQGERGPSILWSDDLIARARFRMPVYACGYNWLDSNVVAAELLRQRIIQVITENNYGPSRCSQVIVVTHSMGGLVARACQKLGGMQEAIAGIAHGVMPTVGAAVAYRRCKIGMKDEDRAAGQVIGTTGQEVTAVFAQAPGALQLLPTQQYRPGWLTISSQSGNTISTQPDSGNPYKDIYLRRDRWWGLIREEWLSPPDGIPLTWITYAINLQKTQKFHDGIKDAYHPMSYVFYGNDPAQKSFEGVHWQINRGMAPHNDQAATADQVNAMGFDAVIDRGSNPLHVGGMRDGSDALVHVSSSWELNCAMQDGGGDGTVPTSSGVFPLLHAGGSIQQQFGLDGFSHEGAYRSDGPRIATLYALQKIAAVAKVSS